MDTIKIDKLIPYNRNAKKHNTKQVKSVADSIKRFGFVQPIVIDKNNEIVIGHCRLEAAKILGLKEVPIISVENLTDKEVKSLRLADNKLNESDWNLDLVIEDLKELDEDLLDLTGFDNDLIIEEDEKDDEVPNVPDEPSSKLGDIYQLGNHKIMCGDSTKIEDVENLMALKKADLVVTDPPYNTGMQGKGNTFDYDWTKKKEKARLPHMFDDKIENWPEFISDFLNNYIAVTKGECAYYVFIDWRKVQDIKSAMEKVMDVKNVIVWDKKVHGLGSDYKSTYELCVVGKRGKPEIKNRYGLDYQDIWRLQREMGRNKMHATVKPIELLEKPIKHASKEDDIVLDLFLGSGSTLIACEKINRICYGMELDPRYISVILDRWQEYTGNEAIRLNDNKKWNEIKENKL